jgi:hypothetical protein
MAYDSLTERTVLVGGQGTNCPLTPDNVDRVCSDQWEWDGACWSEIQTASPIPTLSRSAMAFDGARLVVSTGYLWNASGSFFSQLTFTTAP